MPTFYAESFDSGFELHAALICFSPWKLNKTFHQEIFNNSKTFYFTSYTYLTKSYINELKQNHLFLKIKILANAKNLHKNNAFRFFSATF